MSEQEAQSAWDADLVNPDIYHEYDMKNRLTIAVDMPVELSKIDRRIERKETRRRLPQSSSPPPTSLPQPGLGSDYRKHVAGSRQRSMGFSKPIFSTRSRQRRRPQHCFSESQPLQEPAEEGVYTSLSNASTLGKARQPQQGSQTPRGPPAETQGRSPSPVRQPHRSHGAARWQRQQSANLNKGHS